MTNFKFNYQNNFWAKLACVNYIFAEILLFSYIRKYYKTTYMCGSRITQERDFDFSNGMDKTVVMSKKKKKKNNNNS